MSRRKIEADGDIAILYERVDKLVQGTTKACVFLGAGELSYDECREALQCPRQLERVEHTLDAVDGFVYILDEEYCPFSENVVRGADE